MRFKKKIKNNIMYEISLTFNMFNYVKEFMYLNLVFFFYLNFTISFMKLAN